MTKVRALLENIYGVGTRTSLRWYKQGVRTLEDAKKRDDLSNVQRIGIERYYDFLKKIPREETKRHFETVKEALRDLDPDAECICMGSYRRGRQECGDIDIIITKQHSPGPDANGAIMKELRHLLLQLIVVLFKQGFLKCALAGPDPRDYQNDLDLMESSYLNSTPQFGFGEGLSKWYGASLLEDVGIWRRIDFLLVPPDELGAALLYFTGNGLFNRTIRLLAHKKGYRLNQHGLYSNVIRVNRRKTTSGHLVEGRSERKIFEILGVPYREPSKRDVI